MRNFQKSIVAFYHDVFKMQTVFIETCIQSDEKNVSHAQIESIGVPEFEEMVDLDVYFKKSLLEDDEQWSNHKALIDTKAKRGQIWKCLPEQG